MIQNSGISSSKKKFQRKIEDFQCEKCDFSVKGNGFTDHCPKCLWGKHVDINPGDREEKCGGAMRPVSVEKTNRGFDIIYRCERCLKITRNKSAKDDDFDVLVRISKIASDSIL